MWFERHDYFISFRFSSVQFISCTTLISIHATFNHHHCQRMMAHIFSMERYGYELNKIFFNRIYLYICYAMHISCVYDIETIGFVALLQFKHIVFLQAPTIIILYIYIILSGMQKDNVPCYQFEKEEGKKYYA